MASTARSRGSVRARLTVALFGVAVLPLIALALVVQPVLHRGLAHAERLLQSTALDHADALLENALERAAEGTHQIGAVLFAPAACSSGPRLELARDRLVRVAELSALRVYGPDGKWVDTLVRRDGEARAGDALPDARDCEAGVNGAWRVSPDGPRMEYRESVVGDDGKCTAWLVGVVDMEVLSERLADVSRSVFDRADSIHVLDPDGRVLLPRDGAEARPELRLPESGTITSELTAPDGTAIVASVRRAPGRSFGVAVWREQRVAYASIAWIRRALFLGAALCGLLSIAVGAFVARRTTRPIGELVRLTEAYAQRRFDEQPRVHSGDELETLAGSMSGMAADLAASEREITRRAVVEESLARYVPKELATAIAEGEASLELGGRRRTLSAMFADVVGFTTFAESAPPEKTIAFLNELFTVMTEVIFRHGGTVDKFIGDGVLALFGAVSDEPDHVRRACAAAEDIQRFVSATSASWWERYGIRVELAIGLATGEAVVGNLGSSTRMEFTAIGDMVNTAARLESMARPGQTLTTRQVADAAGSGYTFASLGTHPLRGRSEPIEVCELR